MTRKPPAGYTPAELRAWKGLLAFHARLTRELGEALELSHRISISEFEVLLKLCTAPQGRLMLGELTQVSYLTQSGLSRLVDRLQGRGLVERAGAQTDRRSVLVTVTDEGRAVWSEAGRQHAARVRHCFLDQLSAHELETLGQVWRRLVPDLD